MSATNKMMEMIEKEIKPVMRERDIYHEALQRIAAGEGYYGAQAREYKDIAKGAIAAAKALRKPVHGLNCGVNIRTGKGECVCGRCSPTEYVPSRKTEGKPDAEARIVPNIGSTLQNESRPLAPNLGEKSAKHDAAVTDKAGERGLGSTEARVKYLEFQLMVIGGWALAGKEEKDFREIYRRVREILRPDWVDAKGKSHSYRCGLNPDPDAMKHMVSYCTCSTAIKD
jgi:hypothetical protein